MALTINTNLASINAQRNLSMSSGSLNTSLQRLSSGLRINSAKDDAAGLAISDRMTTQINGLNQASRNANDAISLSQTAEGAMQEMTNNLQAIRTLAVQAANASNSASDRAALDQEVQQRLSEIQRIATQTSFNGQKILDGTFGNAAFQVGANVGDTISINLTQGVKASQMGQIASQTATVTGTALSGTGTIAVGNNTPSVIQVSVAGAGGATNGLSAGSAYAKALAINSSSVSGLTASASNNTEFAVGATVPGTGGYGLTINGQAIFTANTSAQTSQQIADAINANQSTTGVTASLDATGAKLYLAAADGRDIDVTQAWTGTASGGLATGTASAATATAPAYAAGAVGATTVLAHNYGQVTLTATQAITVTGDNAVLGGISGTVSLGAATLSTQNVLSVANANATINSVDAALQTVSSLRSTFGAIQNRFQSTINSLGATTENLTAARSRVLDTDFAAETANLTKNQILTQAGTAILAQANSLPQSVLKLLQ